MRLIDADKIGLTNFEILMCDGDYKEALKMILDKIENAPIIEARLKGEWKEVPRFDGDKQPECVCPFCNYHTDYYGFTNYCPNCGADLKVR